MQRNQYLWPLYVSIEKHTKQFDGWSSEQWAVTQFLSATQPRPKDAHLVFLELFLDERASYRLNLDLDNPKLFIICDQLDDGRWLPTSVTAEQSIATACLESDTPVISIDMPTAIACWIERFISVHGEVAICAHRRKHVDRKKEQRK
ncbi:DUF3305 domain-containing protein [Thalassotalea ponticola]|uniref:DUF3305 domain-containing protein n=1 Tax=Thalassotalea ponticola TaxID=1523392 RepID=UPI0025B5027B|nr:DUF3305 domain-containing protein [Thalassotalea ponticola]MDN3653964.1 DUF3305 domain-containing protein [Thalassotalea ponticola]